MRSSTTRWAFSNRRAAASTVDTPPSSSVSFNSYSRQRLVSLSIDSVDERFCWVRLWVLPFHWQRWAHFFTTKWNGAMRKRRADSAGSHSSLSSSFSLHSLSDSPMCHSSSWANCFHIASGLSWVQSVRRSICCVLSQSSVLIPIWKRRLEGTGPSGSLWPALCSVWPLSISFYLRQKANLCRKLNNCLKDQWWRT